MYKQDVINTRGLWLWKISRLIKIVVWIKWSIWTRILLTKSFDQHLTCMNDFCIFLRQLRYNLSQCFVSLILGWNIIELFKMSLSSIMTLFDRTIKNECLQRHEYQIVCFLLSYTCPVSPFLVFVSELF